MRLAPLADEIESFIQRTAEAFGERDPAAVTEAEIDDVIGRVSSEHQVAPGFEHFFGGIVNAVKNAAKGAVNLAKKGIEAAAKLGLGPILQKLGALVRPLLERVLTAAINRLPAAVQPAARQLASKLPMLFGKELEAETGDELAVDVGAIQSEFNDRTVDALLGETDPAYEAEADYPSVAAGEEAGIGDLDAARERFVARARRARGRRGSRSRGRALHPGDAAGAQAGHQLAGRKRVVGVLSGLVAKLIGRFVGPRRAARSRRRS